MMPAHESYVEKLIRDAQKQGKFDNLANQGQPIKVEAENPYVDEDWRLAFKVLENGGFAPAWVELDKEVEAAIEKVKRDRAEHRRWLYRRLDDIKYGPTHFFSRDLKRLHHAHQQFLKAHALKLIEINQSIEEFNSTCPVNHLLKMKLVPQQILEEFERQCPAIPLL